MAKNKPGEGFTSDGQHIDFGTGDDVPMPPMFNAPDNACTVPGSWGHVVPDDGELNDYSEP